MAIGIEQIGTYSAGLIRYLHSVGSIVLEINTPESAVRVEQERPDRRSDNNSRGCDHEKPPSS